MKLASLKKLVARGEGPDLEFKRSTGELREGMESLCGMLNAGGTGRVVFGVSDSGKILGQDVSETTRREIANASRRLEPEVDVSIADVPVAGGKTVLLVGVSARAAGPFTFDGRPWLRVGNTTQRMTRAESDRRTVARLHDETSWDSWPAADWTIDQLDTEELQRTVDDAVAANRLAGVLGEQPDVLLRRLEVLSEDGLTRAAAVLFGTEDGPGHTLGEIRLARFVGTTKDEFRDNRQYKGHAFALLRHAERFLQEHVPVASTFVPGKLQRDDRPRYPPLSVREALVNAIVHRYYSVGGGAVSVGLYDDRLEIWNVGRLPEGLTPAMLKGTHDSIARNPLIAGVFHRRGLIERWGRGTNKILAEAEKAGCPEPEFEEVGPSFVVRFPAAGAPQESLSIPAEVELSPRGKSIVKILATHAEALSSPQIFEELGGSIPKRTLQRELNALKDAGVIIAAGRRRAATYRVRRADGGPGDGRQNSAR